MENKKSTKRALLSSVLSLVLCMAMLIGTTFAWFTDNVSSGKNQIIAGNLDMSVEYSLDGETWNDLEGATDLFQTDLWEPGHTEVVALKIENIGSLAFKYNVNMNIVSEVAGTNVDDETFKLSDILTVSTYAMDGGAIGDALIGGLFNSEDGYGYNNTVPFKAASVLANDMPVLPNETGSYLVIKVDMPETVGNEANYKTGTTAPSIDFGINVLATQCVEESDTFGPEYDKDAMYAVADNLYIDKETGSYVALSTAGLSAASELASTDSSITSVTYVTDEGKVEVPVVSSNTALDNAIKEGNDIVVLTTGDYTVDQAKKTEVTIVGNGEKTNLKVESEGEHNTDYGFDGSTVTFENVTFNVGGYLNGYARMNATYNNCIINGTYTLNGKGVFNNCTFNKTGDDYCVWTWGAPTAEFNDCTFNTSGKAILLYGGANTILKVSNCVFNDANDVDGVNNKAAIEVGSDWTTDTKEIIATNCTVNGFDITTKGENTGSTLWGNKNSLSKERLNVIIDGVDVY